MQAFILTAAPLLGRPRRATATSRPRAHPVFSSASVRANARPPSQPNPQKNDDDVNLGSSTAYGMRIPELPEEEAAYLNDAVSPDDFRRRLVQIAQRLDQQRHIESARLGRQTADDYLENLGSVVLPPPTPVPKPDPEPVPQANPDGQDLDDQIENLNSQLMEAMKDIGQDTVSQDDPNDEQRRSEFHEKMNQAISDGADVPPPQPQPIDPANPPSEEDLGDDVSKIEALQAQIREEMGVVEQQVDEEAASFHTSPPTNTASNEEDVDGKIAELEEYVARLQQEEEQQAEQLIKPSDEDDKSDPTDAELNEARIKATTLMEALDHKARSSMPSESDVRFEGLENSPGEMSAAEKQAAFEMLRQRAIGDRSDAADFGEPFNVTLPEKRDSPVENAGDVPMGDIDEYDEGEDMGKLVEELKNEISGLSEEIEEYAKKIASASKKREAKMLMIMTRMSSLLE